MKRIAVVTSAGDAPGMNAAVRAVTRCALWSGVEVYAVQRGYAGLCDDDFRPLGARDVGGTSAGVDKAAANLRRREINAVVIIGGNGSQAGAHDLSQCGIAVAGVASTIDNDLVGTEVTIGVDTALNIALEAIDRLKVTASSHRRAFLLEVMGRKCGYLGLMAGLAGGADVIVVPEFQSDPESVAQPLRAAYERGKSHALVVVAEGATHNAAALQQYFTEHRDRLQFELRATKLGHVQRGGAPTAFDRLLASRFGAAAVDHLLAGEDGFLIGLLCGQITATPLSKIVGKQKPLDLQLFELARSLAS